MAKRARKKVNRLNLSDTRKEIEKLRQDGHTQSRRYRQLEAHRECLKGDV